MPPSSRDFAIADRQLRLEGDLDVREIVHVTAPPPRHGPDHERTTHAPPVHGGGPEEWDARYAEADRVWSGNPNGALVAEVAGLLPGRALDVGCGEGADAVWLAGRGWDVTALDVSKIAIDRAVLHARHAGSYPEMALSSSATRSGATMLISTPVPRSNPAVVASLGQMWACQW